MPNHCIPPIQAPLLLIHPQGFSEQPLTALLFAGLLGGRCLLIKDLRRCVGGLGVTPDWKENFPFSLGQQYWSFFECCNQLCAKWGPISPYTAPGIQRKKCFKFSSERLIFHTADQIKTVWANCVSSYPHLLWNPPGRNGKVGFRPALAFCRGRKLPLPSFHGLSETKRRTSTSDIPRRGAAVGVRAGPKMTAGTSRPKMFEHLIWNFSVYISLLLLFSLIK